MKPVLSYVIPFYKRVELFQSALAVNLEFRDKAAEVVIAVDEPESSKDVLELVHHYKKRIRFRVLVNQHDHAWRNPAKAINVGIRHALGRWVAVMSPESVVCCRSQIVVEFCLWSENKSFNSPHHATGQLYYDVNPKDHADACLSRNPCSYLSGKVRSNTILLDGGFICFNRAFAIQIGGYSEHYKNAAGEDGNFRLRMEAAGSKHVRYRSRLKVYHPRHQSGWVKNGYPATLGDLDLRSDFSLMGLDFGNVVFDWRYDS